MFAAVIALLRDELNSFISQKKGAAATYVVMANLNNINDSISSADNKIVISIANIEEERALKSPANYIRENNEISYKQPPVWINLCLLITYFSRSAENYDGIDLLNNVMQYFQAKPILTKTNIKVPASFPQGIDQLRTELVTLNFDQANNLWSLFGGRYYPSVMYKVKSLMIDNLSISEGPTILDTELDMKHKKAE